MLQEQTEDQTTPQWADALAKGNAVRFARAEYKRAMKTGDKTSLDLLLNPPECALDVKIVDVLQWIPGIKRVRALRIMSGLIYQEGMPFGRLSPMTRTKLYGRVEHYRPTYSDLTRG